jgi:hypothetical protein
MLGDRGGKTSSSAASCVYSFCGDNGCLVKNTSIGQRKVGVSVSAAVGEFDAVVEVIDLETEGQFVGNGGDLYTGDGGPILPHEGLSHK